MSDDLRDRIANTLYQELSIELPAAIRGADAVIDLLIDMAGQGELLKAIDRMHRADE